METSSLPPTTDTPEIVEEILSHIAEHDTTRRAIGIYRKRVGELTPEEQIQL